MEIHDKPNPVLQPENYFQQYQENIESLRSNPEVIEFDKMCYELFEKTELGKKFLDFAKERFIVYSQINRSSPTYPIDTVWQEGFRDAYRMIIQHIMSHEQRIKAGAV